MTRWRLSLACAGLAVLWCLAAVTADPPDNPVVDDALSLEASTDVPPDVRATLEGACFDCHSDRTTWPWYARVPPASWLATHDVQEGRGRLNFSRWRDDHPFDRADKLDEACNLVTRGEMPPWGYRLLHPRARLTDQQVVAFCAWTAAEADRLVNGVHE